MVPSRDRDTILAEIISDSLGLKEYVIHLAKLLIGVPVVSSGLGGMFHPLVKMLALVMVIVGRSDLEFK